MAYVIGRGRSQPQYADYYGQSYGLQNWGPRTQPVYGQPSRGVGYPRRPPLVQEGRGWGHVKSHCNLSMFACLCCFGPLGLIAVLCAMKTRRERERGDMEGARDSSRWALCCSVVAIVAGVISMIVGIVLALVVYPAIFRDVNW